MSNEISINNIRQNAATRSENTAETCFILN